VTVYPDQLGVDVRTVVLEIGRDFFDVKNLLNRSAPIHLAFAAGMFGDAFAVDATPDFIGYVANLKIAGRIIGEAG
jgi:hypothetical protein